MDLFHREATDRIGTGSVLSRIDALVDWWAFSPIPKRGPGRSGIGAQGYDPMFCRSRQKGRSESPLHPKIMLQRRVLGKKA